MFHFGVTVFCAALATTTATADVATTPTKNLYTSFNCSTPDCDHLLGNGNNNACQDLNNCPYSYTNTMPDYVPGADVAVSFELNTWMETQLSLYLDEVSSAMPPTKVDTADVFQGVGGRAYMYLRMFDRSGDVQHLTRARTYIDTALANVHLISPAYIGFLWGRTGVYTLAAVIAKLQGDTTLATAAVAEVQTIFDKSVSDSYAIYDDFDAGRAGLIYAASFLSRYFGGDVITRSSIVAVGQAAIRRGKAVSSHPDDYLEWNNPNDYGKWLGQSHGSAGVLCQLLDVPELLVWGSEERMMILKTLDHIVKKQFPSGNFPSQYYEEDEDVLVQWDHGSPGVQGVLAKAAQFWKGTPDGDRFLESAKLAADCTWERGLLYKGLELCHGIVGNTYMQVYMYKLTNDEKYMHRALQFQEFVSTKPELYDLDLMREPTPNPYGFYPGSYEGAIMLWVDLLAAKKNSNDFMGLSMPGYEALI